jgi:hypothetical protein
MPFIWLPRGCVFSTTTVNTKHGALHSMLQVFKNRIKAVPAHPILVNILDIHLT